jgi:hypothetical protein
VRRALPALLVLLTGCTSLQSQFRTKPRVAEVGGDPIVQMAPAENLPSLENPHFSSWKRHTDPPAPWEPVVGIDGRGYPIGLLDRYEVINDRGPQGPYVVARCPLAGVAAVYDRRVEGRTLTFVNSGALWRDTLVLQDLETGTLWTAATGRGLYGPLQGVQLDAIPAVLTTMNGFARVYPDARYLDTGELTETPLRLSLYSASDWQGVSGIETRDRRYEPKTRLFSVSEGTEALAFTEEDLKRAARIETTLAGCPAWLEWDSERDSPRAFRLVEGATEEIAVVPMYWFALDRHFETLRTPVPHTVVTE